MDEEKHTNEYVTLKEYFESKLRGMEKAGELAAKTYETKLEAIDKATTLASNALEKRLEGMNEFRAALKDQTGKFITKEEYNALHNRIIDDIKALNEDKNKFLTKSEFTTLHERVEDDIRILRENKAMLEGKASMKSVIIAYVLAAIAILLAIIDLIIK